ncbi:APC membrane recruitment protein 2-like [Oncorhynchus keta]|uniref:APC membrane recruitment protein 2-like n=1 Tax=Oncorhynchus keta TaxID=8018 RepID=UPI0015F87EA9|nr:APC membrane recruitment protein 2-like [Oncorhynchus keta]XP_052356740.1 APC membrane recruitment protein 2-like [Oncorhynchus keta]XP_052356751.1 APC membrane recruitment protein 2-like [Oncorhynchus keta]XP_052356762.1 APC membrane recruitment protein 2-like [Oncorhynchus keta]XP_052356773.1 APC membrane recruitment protein 2-like [Oncorhynchus keta]XP_052356779.1 APC membrane recruitment protein 2-like [Oncorhynchus keta]XP_052356780.1 APC membrane recruitment protein 2-like [Oncorhync
MEVQSECIEPPPPPCDPQPPGKINKAAFKLFGKRRSGMAGFFSFRNKGVNRNGNSVNVNSVGATNELVRSKTHGGLTSLEPDGQRGEESGISEAGQVRSLSKSLSFFSLLRRGSVRVNENTGFGRRGRGLKGFFSSMKWRRKENVMVGEGEVTEVREGEVILTEEVKEITLTLEPQPRPLLEDHGSSEAEKNTESAGTSPSNNATTPLTQSIALTTNLSESLYTPSPSPLRTVLHSKPKTSISSVTAIPPLDQCDPHSEPSVDRLCSVLFTDVTSLKSFDSLTGCGDIIADAEEEGAGNGGGGVGSATSSSTSSGEGGGGGGVRSSINTHVTPSTSTSATASTPGPLPARARLMPSHSAPTQQPSGSGVVAYMGGGEEMASPDGVDDADMQGLWHMLPSRGENSPTFLRSNSHLAPPRGTERKFTQVKSLGLSKIPVVGGGGGGRVTKLPTHAACQTSSPNEKETKEEVPPQQDVPALRDEGYWDTPSATPTATPDNGFLRNQRLGLLCDSCSGDALYDLYNEELERSDDEEEDLMSTPSTSACEYKLSPLARTTPPFSSSSSSFHSMKGSTSLPRESKIPLSVRQTTPPHSVSQSALSFVHATAPPSDTPTHAPIPARTRIPVSKVPVRRPGNKAGNATQGPAPRK